MSEFSFDSSSESLLADALADLRAGDPLAVPSRTAVVATPAPPRVSSVIGGTGGVFTGGNNFGTELGLSVAVPEVSEGMFLDLKARENVLGVSTFHEGKKRGGGSITPTTKYRIFCLPTDLDGLSHLCLGLIGQGATFCIKEHCMTYHLGAKAIVNLGDIHVMKTNDTCFVEPTVNISLLDDALYTTWLSERVVLDEWTKRMAILKNAESKVTIESFKEADTFASSAKKFKPNAGQKDEATELDALLNDVFKVNVYNRIIDDRSAFVEARENKPSKVLSGVLDVVEGTETALESLSTSLVVTNNEVSKLSHKVRSELPVLFSRQENLETMIGSRAVGTLPNFESPTLWGSLTLLADILTDSRKQIDQIYAEQVNLKNDSTTVASKVAKELVALEVAAVDKRLSSLREGVSAHLKELVVRMNRDTGLIVDLQNKIRLIDELLAGKLNSTPVSTITTTNLKNDQIDLDLQGIRHQLVTLEASVRGLETQGLKDTVKFGKLGFRSIADAAAWVERNQPGDYTFGLVVDIHMIFEHIHFKFNSGDAAQSSITRLHELKRLSITNLNLGTALSSFDRQVPRVFSKDESSPHSQLDESFFDQIENYQAWDLVDHGHRDKILRELHQFELSHKAAVNNHPACSQNGPLYNIATKSLTESIAWIKSFFLYIDNTYDELTRNKFSSKRGWSLVTRLAVAILKDVGGPRNGVNNLWVVGENQKICTLMFYSVVRCHDIMERYKGYNFKSDPAIAGEYVRFLVMNTGLESIYALEKKVAVLETTVSSLSSAVKAADSKIKVNEGAIGDLKGKIAELQKKGGKDKGNNN